MKSDCKIAQYRSGFDHDYNSKVKNVTANKLNKLIAFQDSCKKFCTLILQKF